MNFVKFWEVIALVNRTQCIITISPWACHLELRPGQAETMYCCQASDGVIANGRVYRWAQSGLIQNPESAAFVLCTPELIELAVYRPLEGGEEPSTKTVLKAELDPSTSAEELMSEK
ncbi:MAG: hypothetical protein ACTHNP_12075 [Solirubrobacterales bacterium]